MDRRGEREAAHPASPQAYGKAPAPGLPAQLGPCEAAHKANIIVLRM